MKIFKLNSIKTILFWFFLIFLLFPLSSCTSVIDTVLSDDRFDDGEYTFVMYKSNESSISVCGVMSLYYMPSDSTVTGSYVIVLDKNSIFSKDKGGLIGKANWNSGEAKIKLGNSFFKETEMSLRKYIDIVNGEWTNGYSRGKIYAFKKKN